MELGSSQARGPRGELPGLPRGVYPYLGGTASSTEVQQAVLTYGYAAVSGTRGAIASRRLTKVLVDPATYVPHEQGETTPGMFGDIWLERQQAAQPAVLLTDTSQIRKGDRASLQQALDRWSTVSEPTAVVLAIESWWLRGGLSCLVEEVQQAGRPVALVLLHHYNGLDAAGAVAGMVTLIRAVSPIPVVLLRCDVSAIGAVAYGGYAGFIGTSSTRRHGSLPMRRSRQDLTADRDKSPSVFVPRLHQYLKASRLPAVTRRNDDDILRCDDSHCRGESLLRIARLAELDIRQARAEAAHHETASMERLARTILTASEPKDVWWEHCRSGADTAARLSAQGFAPSAWLSQWLELGSPSHDPATAR